MLKYSFTLLVMVLTLILCSGDVSRRYTFTQDKYTLDLLMLKPELEKAVKVLEENNSLIKKQLTIKDIEIGEVLSIAFPEIIRWNEFQDMIESSVDRTLYVEYGSKSMDLSIGIFQMKPSFVESLETYIQTHKLTKKHPDLNLILLNHLSERNSRLARIKRLESVEWQLNYLYAYWIVASDIFKVVPFANKEYQIRLYASAYNFGFTKPLSQIQNWQNKQFFPYGKNYHGKQFAFSDLSIVFLNNYSHKFNH